MQGFLQKINEHASRMNYPYKGYAIFQLISNPIYYLIWIYFTSQGYENLGIRAGISLLCVPLLFIEIWPRSLIKYLPIYWYVTLFYSLIFFFTFMLLKNNLSYEWSLGALTGVVLWILLIDYKSLFYLTPPGVVTAFFAYYFTTDHLNLPYENIKMIFIAYSSVIIFGFIFSFRNIRIVDEKISTLRMLAGFIAHELRTPLGSVRMYAEGLRSYFRQMSAEGKMQADNSLLEIPQAIEHEIRHSLLTIDMVLTNFSEKKQDIHLEVIDAFQAVQDAINRYPLTENEEDLITLSDQNNFKFLGNEALFTNIIFNLLKNALYAIAAANKGEIIIWFESGKESNKIYFKDTGKGMTQKVQQQIFKPFYSQTKYGSGLGLSFCHDVMKKFKGKIEVESTLSEFTIFTLSFPKIKYVYI